MEMKKKYLDECVDTGWISSEGPFVQRFEDCLAKHSNRKYGVAVSSGTAALEIAIKVLGIGKGDEVILPTHTIISCAQAVFKSGATPIVVDTDINTWNINILNIEKKITSKTKSYHDSAYLWVTSRYGSNITNSQTK